MKYIQSGTRLVPIVGAHAICRYLKIALAVGAVVTMQNVTDFVKFVDSALMESLASHVTMFQFEQPAGTTLFVPHGHLVFENAVNNKLVVAWRWSVLCDFETEGFATVASHMLPDDPRSVKPGSTVAILAKVVVALQEANSSVALKELCAVKAVKRQVCDGNAIKAENHATVQRTA